jgi:hypothetical protein
MSDPQPSNKTPDELIAEFYEVTGVKSGKVTYEDCMIVFRYPFIELPSDRITLPTFRSIIDHERRMQVEWTKR